MAALQGAVASGYDDDVAVNVGEALGLDVTGTVEVLLDETLPAAERRDRLARCRFEELGDFLARAGDLESASTAAECGFDGHGKPVRVDEVEHLCCPRYRVEGARGQRCADPLGDVAGGYLVAELLDRFGGRANPGEAGRDDGARKFGVLGKETVTGMYGVRP